MTKPRTRSVLSGGPVTNKTTDKNGVTTITVNVEEIGPRMAKLADYLSYAAAGGVGIISIGAAILMSDISTIQRGLMLTAAIPAFYAAKYVGYKLLSVKKAVIFKPELYSFRMGLRMQHFDPNFGIKFTIQPHHKAEEEKLAHDLKREKRKGKRFKWKLKWYFQDTYALYLEYMGQSNLICYVFRTRRAKIIVARLTAASEIIARHGSSSAGIAMSPEQEWAGAAGGIIIDHERSAS